MTWHGPLRRAQRRVEALFKGVWRGVLVRCWRTLLWRTTFVVITGSCGKTTASCLTTALLRCSGAVNAGLYWSTVRHVIRTLRKCRPHHRWCVQEVSGWPRGNIDGVMNVLRPQVAIVTLIGTDHLRAFRSSEAIAQEKGRLVERLPAKGLAILNADDPLVSSMASRTRARVIFYGRSARADLRASQIAARWPDRLSFTVEWRGSKRRIQTRLVGEFWTTSILAALACALELGVDFDAAAAEVEKFAPIYSRHSAHGITGGPDFVIDTAKAPYGTIMAVVDFLKAARAPRKTLVIGNISDYAGSSSNKYRKVAREALTAGIRVVGVGANAIAVNKLKAEFGDGLVEGFPDSRTARDFLKSDAIPGELILLKSAASGHIERIFLNWDAGDERCWIEDCGKKYCRKCSQLMRPKTFSHERAQLAAQGMR
jgi:UDP-N-acetylmuramoyl-tripeptide--D-alanyl-D-alanine ligase